MQRNGQQNVAQSKRLDKQLCGESEVALDFLTFFLFFISLFLRSRIINAHAMQRIQLAVYQAARVISLCH